MPQFQQPRRSISCRSISRPIGARPFAVFSALVACALASCSFDEEQPAAHPNTCSLTSECAQDLICQAGVCVTPSFDAPLDVTLEVTPKTMPDGSQPFPILYGPFALQGGRRDFLLAVPTPITGSVQNGGELINAQLTFVPMKAPPSLAKPIQTRTSILSLRSRFSVQLLAGVDYRVTVQPTESAIATDSVMPPYTKVFMADPSEPLDIDYEEIPKITQSFVIRNAPTSQRLMIKARAKDGSQILSNAQPLNAGRASLTFAGESLPEFRIEIAADQTFASNFLSTASSSCDSDVPLVPTLTVDDTAFKREASTKTQPAAVSEAAYDLAVDLPELPEPVAYSGTIELCEKKRGLENLLVSVRSSALALKTLPPGISAAYSVSTTAETTSDHSFCARVMPGDYVVVVTPPANVNCEIFAEKRQIVQDSDEPDALALRVPAKLNGKVLDSQMLPIANATIDAIALGIDTTMMLAENDPTVPTYNRSRQTSSSANGSFSLYIDVGVYDLIVKPPAQSGFGWQIQPGLNVGGSRSENFTTRVEMSAPALIEGSLRYMDRTGQRSLAGAEVHAYTVEDEKTPNARGIEIGHTQADENGNVMLLVSPEPQPPW
jgi:hypothetical protein